MNDELEDRRAFLIRSSLRAALLAGTSCWARQTGRCAENAKNAVEFDDPLNEMAAAIFDAVRRQDTGHPVFHGCIDWHSAVHGHWALLRIANHTKHWDQEYQWVMSSLDPQRLANEDDNLQRRRGFEMPYGRAWFLRLAIEFESLPNGANLANAKQLREMAHNIAASLLDYCTSRELSPQSREYDNDSWALAQLHAFYRHRAMAPELEQASSLIEKFFLDTDAERGVDFGLDHTRPDFFSPFGNWAYLVFETQDRDVADRFWESHRPSDASLRPVAPQPLRAHHLGVNWCRAWALRVASRIVRDEDERSRLSEAYQAHVRAGLETHRQHKNDYGAYGHWAPQFSVYALTS